MLNGHVEVPHLADAEEDRYMFKDVDVGTGWRGRVIFEMQGPINLSCLSIGKCELGLGRNVLFFDGLSKTLDCVPAAHGSGTSVVQDHIGQIVLRADDGRRQLCRQKALLCCDGQIVF